MERLQAQKIGQVAAEKKKIAEVGTLKKLEKEEVRRKKQDMDAREKALEVINTSRAQSQVREEVMLWLHKTVEEVNWVDLNALPLAKVVEEATRKLREVEKFDKLQKEKERNNVVEVGN